MIKSRSVAGRLIFCIAAVTVLFVYVAAMAYRVQIARHDELLKKAQGKYITESKTSGKRGEIFDRNGSLLVGNLPCYNVCADPSLTGDEKACRDLAKFLAPIIEEPEEEIFQKLMKKTRVVKKKDGSTETVANKYVVLHNTLEYEVGRKLVEQLKARQCKAVFLEETVKRFYPKKQLLSNVLGVTTKDRDSFIANVGMEKFYNAKMNSRQGKKSYERTRKGAPIAYGEITVQEVKDGLNIYLTVDEAIQTILEEELDKLYNSEFKPTNCFAVIADPWTGDILAMAQRPTFDPNDRKNIKPAAWRNKMIENVFDPGSIMKPVTIAGAIDNGVVTPDTLIECGNRKWYYGGASLGDDHYIGTKPVSEVLIQSSNIGTAKIGVAMGNKLAYDNLRKFGFGQKTGVQLPSESPGILRPTKKWRKITVTRVTIGQGISVTTLQMVRAYCMLANGGRPLSLNLVDRLEDPETKKIEKIERKLGESIYKRPDTHEKMVKMMVGVTTTGTGRKAAIPGYHVAGKTGTAQKVVNGKYSKQYYVSSFAGFVPAYKPRFVLIVVTDEPDRKAGYYASKVAAPTFRAIGERTLQYLGVPKDFEPEEKTKAGQKKSKKRYSAKKR